MVLGCHPISRLRRTWSRSSRKADMNFIRILGLIFLMLAASISAASAAVLEQFLGEEAAGELVPGAEGFGPIREDLPVAPVLKDGQTIAWAFVTSDFVGTTGYSGRPIHTLVAIDDDAKVVGVRLVKHSEPIVLIGIPESRVKKMVEGYAGLDLVAEARSSGTGHDVDIISGATVTVRVIDDTMVRPGLRVARPIGLAGLAPEAQDPGPRLGIAMDAEPPADWLEAEGDGTLRRLSLNVAQVNEAFAIHADERARTRPLTESGDSAFIEMQTALVSVPAIGQALLEPGDYTNLEKWMSEGDSAIIVMGRGLYSFKGSGYVRGGVFDRIVLIQDDISVRFHDRDHRRVARLALSGAPDFPEMDLFRIPADSEFDPTKPFRIQLLVQREVGPIDKAFLTFDLGYQLPAKYLHEIAPPPPAPAEAVAMADRDEATGQSDLWKRIWEDSQLKIAFLIAMLALVTGVFFFQTFATRNERGFYIFRMAYLTVTLVVLGWYLNAQLSVVNLIALFNSFITGFSWQAFLLDPLTFILWFAVAAALLFWGRGAY